MRITGLVILFTLGAGGAGAQPTDSLRIRVGRDVPLEQPATTKPLAEPHLSVDPANAAHMIVAAIAPSDPLFGATQDCAIFVTFDGGVKWARRPLGVRNCVDPWTELLSDGSAVVAALASSRLLVFRSADGGRTWGTPADLGIGHDHPTLAYHPGVADDPARLYAFSGKLIRVPNGMHAAVFLGRSSDGGVTFADTATRAFTNLNFNVDRSVALTDGSALALMTDHMRNVDGHFSDGGVLERSRTWVARSADGGRTFSPMLFVTESCGRAIGFPTAAVDRTNGPWRDRVYVGCASRARDAILVTRSVKGLVVWSEPVRVGNSGADSLIRRTAGVVVNTRGVVGVSWLQQANAAGCWRVMFAASGDGGETFTRAVAVSTATSCVDTPANGPAARRWAWGGEYIGFAAAADGTFRVVWPDSRSGVYQLRYASVEVR